jgi:hypothetical protein
MTAIGDMMPEGQFRPDAQTMSHEVQSESPAGASLEELTTDQVTPDGTLELSRFSLGFLLRTGNLPTATDREDFVNRMAQQG